jgi:hypothetical protein
MARKNRKAAKICQTVWLANPESTRAACAAGAGTAGPAASQPLP